MNKDDYTKFVTFEDYEIGQTWELKAVSITLYGLSADFSTSPTSTVTIS